MNISRFKQNYRRKTNGIIGGIYFIAGTPEEIADYKAKQGTNYREDNGEPLFFGATGIQPGTPLQLNFDQTAYVVYSDLAAEADKQQDRLTTLRAVQALTGASNEELVKLVLGMK